MVAVELDRPLAERRAGFVLIIGAAVYAGLVGGLGWEFTITPFTIGVAALVAGVVGERRRLVPIGLALLGWGLAVLLVAHSVVPGNRTSAAYIIGTGVGLLAANVVARRWRLSLTGALVTAINGGLALYLSYDFDVLDKWQFWAVLVAAWGVFELVRRDRPVRSDD